MSKLLPLALALTFLLTACLPPTEAPATPGPSDPLSAVVGDLSGSVNGKPSAVETLAPVSLGFTLRTGGQVQTGDDSKARLDFSDQSILRVAANSSYTLEGVQLQGDGSTLTQVQLSFGRLWASLTGGELQVTTPVAVASVRGSFAIFVYQPGDPNNPDDDLLVVDCLEGSCTATNPNLNEQLGNLERLVIGPQGSLRQPLTAQDVQAFVLENPESGRLVATLTAAPPATDTPTTPPTVTPTFTLTPVSAAPVVASDTPAPVAPGATPTTATLGEHIVRAGETLLCIGRGYGVLPEAIAAANAITVNARLSVGVRLLIPAVQWTNISAGPVCPPQFQSPFPGLPVSAATATRAPVVATFTPTQIPTGTGTLAPQISFTADATSLTLGQCTNLRWTTANVKQVFLDGVGVVGNSVQQVCPQQTTTYTLTVNTGTATETRTITITVAPPTPTPTNTPPADTQGPTILRAVVNPTQIGSRGPNKCNLTFTADVTDQSPIAFVEVQWTAFDLQGQQVGSGSGTMQLLTGNTYRHEWFNVSISSVYGSIVWRVNTADIFDNTTNASGTPNVIDVPTALGGCP